MTEAVALLALSTSALLAANNATSVVLLTSLVWLVHLNMVDRAEPYRKPISIGYAGFGLTVIAIMLSRNIPLLVPLVPTLAVIGKTWLSFLFVVVGCRLQRLYPDG